MPKEQLPNGTHKVSELDGRAPDSTGELDVRFLRGSFSLVLYILYLINVGANEHTSDTHVFMLQISAIISAHMPSCTTRYL